MTLKEVIETLKRKRECYDWEGLSCDSKESCRYCEVAMDIAIETLEKYRWIPVSERLPEENEYVMIWCGECQIARIERGISEEQRKAMKRGELDDPCETGWTLSSGYFTLKRSQAYKACDEQGNNRVPYCWYANGGPMQWFGQDVTHWSYLPQPPKGE